MVVICHKGRGNACIYRRPAFQKGLLLRKRRFGSLSRSGTGDKALAAENTLFIYDARLGVGKSDRFDRAVADAFNSFLQLDFFSFRHSSTVPNPSFRRHIVRPIQAL